MKQNDYQSNKTLHFRFRVYSKTELARKYMVGDATGRSARRFLTDCIKHNKELYSRLLATGYTDGCRKLTPKQVQIIVETLGAP